MAGDGGCDRLNLALFAKTYSQKSRIQIIVKSGDDCRQEHLAVQLISHFYEKLVPSSSLLELHDQHIKAKVVMEAGLPLWLRPYEVLVTSSYTALIETIPDTASIHSIKSRFPTVASLRDFYVAKYQEDSPSFKLAQRNFVESMAGYSLVCYLLQVKDRHNGNLLLDEEGHIIHIDFGFMLSNSPGGVNFESAPFKLTRELLEVNYFNHFFASLDYTDSVTEGDESMHAPTTLTEPLDGNTLVENMPESGCTLSPATSLQSTSSTSSSCKRGASDEMIQSPAGRRKCRRNSDSDLEYIAPAPMSPVIFWSLVPNLRIFSFFFFSLFFLFSTLFVLISSLSSVILSLYALFISFSLALCSNVLLFKLTFEEDDLRPETYPAMTPLYVGFPNTGLFGSASERTACLLDDGGIDIHG
ncbi:hypothetical protein RJ640_014562 [Escallonia rubra]|uniref:PI3K/PI4K catalytic domain-containing protein n=1 Tax=Escallonia rubra TaxID=112253 RepID=A0AA88R039_9ASTE|nr:hypothetical protein RJ640_014562 [Escallonia rubra]